MPDVRVDLRTDHLRSGHATDQATTSSDVLSTYLKIFSQFYYLMLNNAYKFYLTCQ